MNFDKSFKVFELNVLRQSGIMVTPQQVGLSSDPLAQVQLNGASSLFGNMLSQMNGSNGLTNSSLLSLTPPVAPTPPSNPSDTAAETKYQQDMVVYQNNMQIYNQRMMQLMLNQMSSMQLAYQNSAMQSSMGGFGSSSGSSSSGGSSSSSDMGIGSILY